MYSNEKSAQIIVDLLKSHGIRKIIASPGTTNFGIVGSLQQDPFFQVFSSVDERSAAYMACGMAAASGEPVAISCTGATASRDYMPGLTEAYYRKLPVVAITSFNGNQNLGQLVPQNLDRTTVPNDVALKSVQVPVIKDGKDANYCNRIVNDALLECVRHGTGPVHINVCCDYESGKFETASLPKQRVIKRILPLDEMPSIDGYNKIAVFIGAHVPFTEDEQSAIEGFSLSHNAAVLCDHTSNYHGSRSLLFSLAAENTSRWASDYKDFCPDLIIDFGEVSGDYPGVGFLSATKADVWRVAEDGEVRDRFGSLKYVFEMPIKHFFECYSRQDTVLETGIKPASDSYYSTWAAKDARLRGMLPELPFTNRWIASQTAPMLPADSVLHMAILNSLRSWNYCNIDDSIRCFCNTGGFGIDGCLSTAIGSSLAFPDRLTFVATGDLAFFYDMNALGNRHLTRNMRIILVNNGTGAEFHMPYSPAYVMGQDVDAYVAAAGHFANHFDEKPDASAAQHWCEAMGIAYMHATSKTEFSAQVEKFVSGEWGRPVVFECVVDVNDEEHAAGQMASIDPENSSKRKMINAAKKIVPRGIQSAVKRALS